MRDIFQVVGWLEDGHHLISQAASLASLFSANSAYGSPNSSPQQQISANPNSNNNWGLQALAPGGGNQKKRQQQTRALMLPDGQLYLARVQLRDANKSYRCQIKNLLSGRLSLSAISGRLFVTGKCDMKHKTQRHHECFGTKSGRDQIISRFVRLRSYTMSCSP